MKFLCLILSLWLFTGLCDASAYKVKKSSHRIEKFVNAQGFYQNTVNAIVSDKNGYIWFATPNGLTRYDGYSFEYYYNDPENPETLPNNYITSLLNDSNGKLWIGTQQGLCMYFADKEQFLPLKCSAQNITFIKEDQEKRVWIASGSTLFVCKSGGNVTNDVKTLLEIPLVKFLGGNKIIDLVFFSNSELIIATNSSIYKVIINLNDGTVVEFSKLKSELKRLSITKLLKTNNIIWVGTNNGLFKLVLKNKRIKVLRKYFYSDKAKSHKSCHILSLLNDTQKTLWIGTTRNGIFKLDDDKNEFISFNYDPKNGNGLTSNRINCLFEDDFGVLWIGTAQGGINKLDINQKPFHNYSYNPYDKHSLSGNLITNICEGHDGRIWISCYGNTICRTIKKIDLNNGHSLRFERLEKQLGKLNKEIVVRIFQDSKGFWWIGTQNGIYLYNEDNEKLYPVKIKSGKRKVHLGTNRVIDQLDDHSIVIGGVNICLLKDPWESVIEGKVVQINNRIITFKNNHVLDFVPDSFGFYWVATQNGIYRVAFDNEELIVKNHYTTKADSGSIQLSHNNVFCLNNNLNKDILAGSFGGGLMDIQLDSLGQPKKIKVYHKKDGLPDEVIYGILEDSTGDFWLSTDMGICKFDPILEKFEVYDVNDGVANYNFRKSAYLKTKSGLILMGGLNGLTVFDPKAIKRNIIRPKVILSKLKINNRPVLAGQEVNGQVVLENSISQTHKFVLSNKNRNISLEIIVQHTSAPKKNRLSYMLEGVNTDWIEVPNGKTTATYTNLSSGTYHFKYKGANGDGLWTKNTADLTIVVLAPWYLRWYSLLFWIFLFFLIIYEIFNYLVRLEKLKQKLKFEKIDKERIHEMDQSKLRFFTDISHEFKTPLSLIMGPLEKISQQNKRPENKRYFSIIQNNILRLQRLIDQLISYRKAETGYLELRYSKITLGHFIYPLLDAFEEDAKRMNRNFFYKVYDAEREIIIDIDKVERIILNFFSNAVKYSGLNGNVSIEARFKTYNDKEMLDISVIDNGIGISPEKIGRIFDRFYRAVDEKENLGGTGIGLSLCKALADFMKGIIHVESDPGVKTSFTISLPIIDEANVKLDNDLANNRRFVRDLLPVVDDEIIINESDKNNGDSSILIIDDEADVRSFLWESFHEKYNVVLAEDGEDGLDKLAKNKIQLVICDVMMPKMDGFKVCEKIKSNSETCYVPVILLTALDETSKQMEGLEYGADDYLTKPFSISHLELRVKKLIENRKQIIDYFSSKSIIPKNLTLAARDRKFLDKITKSIEKNMSDSSFGVEELAKEAGMSTSHFFRRLKQLTGQVPNVYLRNFRLQKAAELLKANKKLSANEVMSEIGIESPSYFSTSFKKIHGVTPSEFVKRL